MKVRFGRALTCCVAVAAAAGLSMFVGASEAGAWNVTSGLVSVSAVHLNHVAVSDVTVAPGATINVKFKYAIAANSGCPGCVEQIQVGFASQNPDQCIVNPATGGTNFSGSLSYAGTAKFKETAPAAAGSYFLAFAFGEDFNCFQTSPNWWGANPPDPQTQYYAHVTVT